MLKRLRLLIAFVVCFSANVAQSAEDVKVVVLPFEIRASKELGYLESEIPKVIETQLEQEGVNLLETGVVPDALFKDDIQRADAMRRIGVDSGADYVIWGSLTLMGQRLILEAKVVESLGFEPADTLTKEGEGLEALPILVKELVRNLSKKMLKRETIVGVTISGNERIESDTIKRVITSAPGEIYVAKRIPEDILAIHTMGYFDDVRAEVENVPGGKSVVFTVKEKETIRQILISGNRAFENDKILEGIDISIGSILNIHRIKANIDTMVALYKGKNYHNVKVKYAIRSLENNQADLIFVLEEGERLFVENIRFQGNDSYTDEQLKGLMKTSEKGFFSWITSSGNLKTVDLEEDIVRLQSHYQNSGYISATVDQPVVEYKDSGISITLGIHEGARFTVGNVEIVGDLIDTRAEMMKKVNVGKEKYLNRETVGDDVIALADLYADEGYAYAEIIPKTDAVAESKIANIAYTIERGKQVYFEKINITGNTKTKDKVIRRELVVEEQGLFSGKKLKRSVRNLYRLGFFEPDISVDTSKGSADDMMVLDIGVKEAPTSAFNFGALYSEYEGALAQGSFEERNFLGNGHYLRIAASLGGISDIYLLSYTVPWLFDIPLAAGIDVFKQDIDYYTYDLSYTGFGLRFGYPIFDFTRVYLSYTFEKSEVKNFTWFVPGSVWNMETSNTASIISAALRYDSRDRQFESKEGAIHGITFQYAGLGGDVSFAKTLLETGRYFPIHDRLVGFIHGEGGVVREIAGDEVPDYNRFYLGGINSLRGFEERAIGVEKTNAWGLRTITGGDKYVQFNFELLFALVEEAGVQLVLFYDTGNVFDDHERIDLGRLRQSAGFGFRWYSPMGPIRLENGYILDPKPGESSGGNWVFTIGTAF